MKDPPKQEKHPQNNHPSTKFLNPPSKTPNQNKNDPRNFRPLKGFLPQVVMNK
jgi:hypothetical protein